MFMIRLSNLELALLRLPVLFLIWYEGLASLIGRVYSLMLCKVEFDCLVTLVEAKVG